MPDTLSINEFAAKIKERRPDLAGMDDGTLVGKLLASEPSLKPLVRMEYNDKRGATYQSPERIPTTRDAVLDGMQNVGEGAKNLVPDTANAIGSMGTRKGVLSLFERLKNPGQMAKDAVQPAVTLAKQGMEYAVGSLPDSIQPGVRAAVSGEAPGVLSDVPSPDDPRTAGMQRAAGANLAASVLPAVGQAAAAKTSGAWNAMKGKLPDMSSITKSPELNKWMNVTPKAMEHGANPANQILSDRLLAKTKEATQANVKTALRTAGKEIETALDDATLSGAPPLDGTPLIDNALNSVVKKIGTPRDPAFQAQIAGIKSDILGAHPNLNALTPKESQALIRHLGDSINWSSAVENPINDAMIQLYGDLRRAQITTQVPQLEPLLSKWQNLYVGDKSLSGSMLKDAAGVGTGKNLLFNKFKSGARKSAIVGGVVGGIGGGIYAGTKLLD